MGKTNKIKTTVHTITSPTETTVASKQTGALSTSTRRIVVAAISIFLSLILSMPMFGCMGSYSTTSTSNTNTTTVQQSAVQISLGAQNSMVNNALQLTVTDVQRRPLSIFSGASISGSDTSSSSVSAMSTSEICIQVDVQFTWNANTYASALTAAGNSTSSLPSSLEDLLVPGTLMYIEGTDADGNQYLASDIIIPSSQSDVNSLAINSQWDYAIIEAELPETSVQASGSILFRVASTACDLQLIIITPTSGQSISSASTVTTTGNTITYTLPLS